jgi:hypothetical protein
MANSPLNKKKRLSAEFVSGTGLKKALGREGGNSRPNYGKRRYKDGENDPLEVSDRLPIS